MQDMQAKSNLVAIKAHIVDERGGRMTPEVVLLVDPAKVNVAWGWSGPMGDGVLAAVGPVQLYIKADEWRRVWGVQAPKPAGVV